MEGVRERERERSWDLEEFKRIQEDSRGIYDQLLDRGREKEREILGFRRI